MRFFLLALSLARVLPAEEWSRFRGPNGSGIVVGTDQYPVKFGPQENLAWRTPIRPGKSSPVLTSTSLFLTGFEDEKFYVQCYARSTGELRWERSEPRTRKDTASQRNHPAALTPVTDGENVYALFQEFGLLCYSATGQLRWRTPIDPTASTQGLGASPILAGDTVVILVDQVENSYIAAYAKSTGELRWKVARAESESWATPLLHQPPGQPLQIITAGKKTLGAHLVSTGKRTFTFPGIPSAMVASPIMDGHTLLAFGYGVATSSPFSRELERRDKNKDGRINRGEYTDSDNIMYSIGRYFGNRDGEITEDEWIAWGKLINSGTALFAVQLDAPQPTELWRTEKGFDGVIPSPLLHDGLIYVVRNGGLLTTYDAKTGRPAEPSRITGALGGYSASPVLANGLLYFASEDGKISVVRPGREWQVLQVNPTGDRFFATPALSKGNIYARGNHALFCFSTLQTPSRSTR